MKISSLSEIKKAVAQLSKEDILEVFNNVVKFSKENKELTHYFLFESDFEENYILKIKEEISLEFSKIDKRSWKTMKKTIQRILRSLKKYIKYSKKPTTEIELLLHFCSQLRKLNISSYSNQIILNIYIRQINIINKTLQKLHEDLQFDYKEEIEDAEEILK
jgi:hypothetical protein